MSDSGSASGSRRIMSERPSFPRQHAATRRFTLGRPRNVRIAPDGGCVLFLRSRGGEDPVNLLWRLDLRSGEEEVLVDPAALATGDELAP
ncbi:MAG: hypothetical protein ACRDUY_12075, partial [Nitriliruptorales bacterium]